MRALWTLVVVCLVAATGVRPADARSELGPAERAELDRATPSAPRASALRPSLHVTGERRAHAPDLRLPPAALSAGFAARIPPARAVARLGRATDRIVFALILTRSARGPPVA